MYIYTCVYSMHIGKVAYDRIYTLLQRRDSFNTLDTTTTTSTSSLISTTYDSGDDNNTDKWFRSTALVLTRSIGVLLAFLLDHSIEVINVCSLGSNILINGLESLLDPFLNKLNLPTIESNPTYITIIHTILLYIGIKTQLYSNNKHNNSGLPQIFKILLSPLLGFEFFLKKKIFKGFG